MPCFSKDWFEGFRRKWHCAYPVFKNTDIFTQSLIGSGSIQYGPTYVSPRTGVVANSLSLNTFWGFIWGLNGPVNAAPDSWNATKSLDWEFTVSREPSEPQAVARVQMKASGDAAEGDLTDVGMGIRIDNFAVIGEAFGTARQTIALNSIASTSAHVFRIKYYPGSRIEFWQNKVYVNRLTGTALPANAWLNKIMILSFSIKNGDAGGVNAVMYAGNMFFKRQW